MSRWKEIQWNRMGNRLAKVAKVASTVLESAVVIQKKTSPLGVASELLKSGTTLLEMAPDINPQKSGRFVSIYLSSEWAPMILPWLSYVGEEGKYREFEIFGRRVFTSDNWLYVESQKSSKEVQQELLRQAARALWERYGRRMSLTFCRDKGNPKFSASVDMGLPSPQGEEIVNRARKFLDNNSSRSLLLHGPPGTGKSQMALYVAQNLGRYALLVHASQLGRHAWEQTLEYVSYLRPSVLIIDDMDQVDDSSSNLLSFIDRTRSLVDLFVGTANQLSALDSAALRAGRIDEVVEVLSVRSVEDIIPGLSPEQYDKVRSWPIAFQVELNRRLEVLGQDSFPVEFERLSKRENLNQEYERRGKSWK